MNEAISESDREFPHDFRLVAIDETGNWADDITAITGRIAGVYLIDFGTITHICSLEGSYWAEFVCNIFERDFRGPDGYDSGQPIWDEDAFLDDPEYAARSKALEAVCMAFGDNRRGAEDLQYDNGGEDGMYLSERMTFAKRSAPVEIAPESDDPARDAMEGVQEYMANGEDWADLAPWNNEPASGD